MKPSLPERLAAIAGDRSWQQITIGHSESSTFLLSGGERNLYLKTQSKRAEDRLREERDRLLWLAGKLPVPSVAAYEEDEEREWLLISEVPGVHAADPSWGGDVFALARALGEGLRRIHALAAADCPFDQRLDVKLTEAGRRTAAGLVDEADFDAIRRGQGAEALYETLLSSRPETEDVVFTHGDYCLPNVILQGGRVSGYIDWGRAGMADRYQDIALALRSLRYNFGAGHEEAFLAAYGMERADEEKVEYYQLLDEFF